MNNEVKNQKKEKSISWLDLTEEELTRLTDVSICMYKAQGHDPK